ncbi:hypothetical protein ACFV23_23840, partial [Streptomyces sp. NPDC059627]
EAGGGGAGGGVGWGPGGAPAAPPTIQPLTAPVRKGDEVAAGEVVGTVEAGGAAHCGGRVCVHWGLLRGDGYVDPLLLLPPWLRNGGPSRLLPVLGVPLPEG